jgi:nucleotide-binding universal stress UspA family protein
MTEQPTLFHTILAATATGSSIDAAVLTATRLAVRQHARLYIVHAMPLPESAGAVQRMHALYAAYCQSLKPDDVQIARGVAWEAVFRAAVKLDCDLIVMGPHARSAGAAMVPKTKRFLGSTADGVISQARCPVLIANRAFNADQLDFNRVVVGVDFSDSCTAAVGLAALFAKHRGAFISTFHMLPIPPYPKYTPKAVQADHVRQQKRMNALCSRLLEGVGHQSILKPGVQPHVEILQFVQQIGADLIVMGSHTRDKTGKWYSGSVVQQVACHARCPVIVVNGQDALKPWGLV